ncbi:MAG: hypothetical protein IJI59_06765 [Clostridia bacterium]|nr:hypothetical protein [Clostridia bacterium]
MVRLINRTTGTEMWVHETRLQEYLALGHQLAPAPEPPKSAPKKPRTAPKK